MTIRAQINLPSSFFFLCGRSVMLRTSDYILPGIGWCGSGLLPFPTACWWLIYPASITGVFVAARWNSHRGYHPTTRTVVDLLCQPAVTRQVSAIEFIAAVFRKTRDIDPKESQETAIILQGDWPLLR